MNKRLYMKAVILLSLGLCVFAGCSASQERKYTREELDNLAEIRIYSAKDDELVKTINDEEQLYQYNRCPLFESADIEEHQEEWKKNLEGAEEQYYLVSYKYPAARFGGRELEENTTITVYEDTNIIKMEVAQESIKAFSIPEEFLVFYYELSEEELNFFSCFLPEKAVK